MSKEMTRVEALAVAIAEVEGVNPAAYEVLVHMREQLQKPKAKTATKSKTRLENEATARTIYNMVGDEPFMSDYVMAHTAAITPQKVVGIMKVGIELGLFEKFKNGKQTAYRAIR